MDTSETYIKMCEKADEIQGILWGDAGDCFYKRDGIGYGLWLVCKVEHGSFWCSGERMDKPPFNGKLVQFIAPENYIWLPRQDQLQEMVLSHLSMADLAARFGSWCWELLRTSTPYLMVAIEMSMEQLWLAFVMKEKYSKQWLTSSQEWVKI